MKNRTAKPKKGVVLLEIYMRIVFKYMTKQKKNLKFNHFIYFQLKEKYPNNVRKYDFLFSNITSRVSNSNLCPHETVKNTV